MIINGREMETEKEGTIAMLIETLDLDAKRVVFEINGEIIPKEAYETFWVDKRAQVEIVSFVGGG